MGTVFERASGVRFPALVESTKTILERDKSAGVLYYADISEQLAPDISWPAIASAS